jgi:hypothetical protein
VGEQGDGAAAAMTRLGSTFDNMKDAVALAAVPFVENFAPVIQEFVDENAPKLFETLEKISTYLFGRPGGMVEDPITGMLRIDPGQVGAAERWAGELRRILKSVTEGDWGGLLQPLTDWLDSGEYKIDLARIGTEIGRFLASTIASALGDESTTNALATNLGMALGKVPASGSRLLWGVSIGVADMLDEKIGAGGLTQEELEWLQQKGVGGVMAGISQYFLPSTAPGGFDPDPLGPFASGTMTTRVEPEIDEIDWAASGRAAGDQFWQGFASARGPSLLNAAYSTSGLLIDARAQGVR